MLVNLLAFLPILILLVLSLTRGVRTGVYGGLAVTVVLFFVWQGTLLTFTASVFSALISTVSILMIIFGAIFLYQVLDQKGFVEGIKTSLSEIHPDRSFRFYFLAFFLTAFFESVAGFGTPGAIVPLLLISMGFSPVFSVSVVLLIDGLFALTGAVGTPVTAGLVMPLELPEESVREIYTYSAVMMGVAGLFLTFFVTGMVQKEISPDSKKVVWIFYGAIMLPFVLLAGLLQDIAGLLASVFMALFCYAFLFRNKKLQLKPWLPYWLLVVLLLIPRMYSPLADMLDYRIDFPSLFGTEVNASFQPLKSPLIPFLISGVLTLFLAKDYSIKMKPIVSRTFTVFLVLFPSLVITQLMLNSGGELPSMIETLSDVFSKAGVAYPVISPLIGVLGTFISGSTTVSNVIFSPIQNASAESLAMSPEVILSLQLSGASLGNAVCLFNIIAAAAVAGISDYTAILKKNLLPVVGASLICSVVGYIMMAFWV